MKKILVTTALCLIGAATVMAQGRIAFANSTATSRLFISDGTVTQVLGTTSTAYFGVGPASASIRLFAGYTSSALIPVLVGTANNEQLVKNTSSTIAGAQGTFAGGNPLILRDFSGVNMTFDGANAAFLRFTYSVSPTNGAFAGGTFAYTSPIISVTPTISPAGAATVFGGALWGPATIIVPEPSTFALAGLGAAAMLIFRRRK